MARSESSDAPSARGLLQGTIRKHVLGDSMFQIIRMCETCPSRYHASLEPRQPPGTQPPEARRTHPQSSRNTEREWVLRAGRRQRAVRRMMLRRVQAARWT